VLTADRQDDEDALHALGERWQGMCHRSLAAYGYEPLDSFI
jgi:hypothetical protein